MAKKNRHDAPAPTATITLAELADRYLAHMQEAGKSPGTCFSYGMELKTAQAELGAETPIGAITSIGIERFNTCDRVMKLRSGLPKAEPSFMKTRRVLRLALLWAVEAQLLAAYPLPEVDDEGKLVTDEPPAPEATPDLTVVVGDALVTDGASAPEAKKRARKSKAAVTSESGEPTAA